MARKYNPDKFRQYIAEFETAAKESPEKGAEKLVWYVKGLSKFSHMPVCYAFDLAMRAVGTDILHRPNPTTTHVVLSRDEQRAHPNLSESIIMARETLKVVPPKIS